MAVIGEKTENNLKNYNNIGFYLKNVKITDNSAPLNNWGIIGGRNTSFISSRSVMHLSVPFIDQKLVRCPLTNKAETKAVAAVDAIADR